MKNLKLLALALLSIAYQGLSQTDWTSVDKILTMSGVPTVSRDQRVYICVGKNLVVYNLDYSLNWTANLRTGSCGRLIAPIVDTAGRVYLATQNYVQVVTQLPYSASTRKYSVSFLYNMTDPTLNSIGSNPITGLSSAQSNAAAMFYVNTGTGGLYGVSVEGTPRWSLGGYVLNNTNWQKADFGPDDFCSSNTSVCQFYFSPGVDLCDGSIYIAHSNGWVYAIAGWQPFIRWRYNLGVTGEAAQACVTAGNNGLVYVGVISLQTVYAIDRQTGDLIWSQKVGPMSRLTCYPRVDVSGWVFIGSADGYLYAISPSGDDMKMYLQKENKNSVIQTPPYLECIGGALYVAHVEVMSKVITYGVTPTIVTYSDALNIYVSQLDPFTGALYRRNTYPGPTSLGGGCTFDSSLILALTAQNIAPSGPCKNAERSIADTCVGPLSLPALPAMSNKKFEEYSISIPTIFLGLVLAALAVFTYWSRKTKAEKKKVRDERRKDLGLPKDKKKLSQRKAEIDSDLTDLREKYLSDPTVETEQQLVGLLNESSILEMLISEQAHGAASQHGLRRRLEVGQFAAYSSGRNVNMPQFEVHGAGHGPQQQQQEVIGQEADQLSSRSAAETGSTTSTELGGVLASFTDKSPEP